MADFIRRLVSGHKARFKDDELDLELDLVYITDQVIIMGYPAEGIEGLYRNRRTDAKRFLDHRHTDRYWVFNFCPTNENAYPASVFDGRVSRYPFPDHHAPPLAILPLAAREMRAWLDGAPDRVVVLHCKAGKGRSGTLACAYLLTLADVPTPPHTALLKAHTLKEQATARAEAFMDAMPPDEAPTTTATTADRTAHDPKPEVQRKGEGEDDDPVRQELSGDASAQPNSLRHVLDLHTSRRMRRASSPSKVRQGVSIPSQRRWLYYWSLILAHQAPQGLWLLPSSTDSTASHSEGEGRNNAHAEPPQPKVRLTQIAVHMRALSGAKAGLIRAANALLERAHVPGLRAAAAAQSRGHVWASLARYEDALVEVLETQELQTRSVDGDFGRRSAEAGSAEGAGQEAVFRDMRWDGKKMVCSFARLGCVREDASTQKDEDDEDEKLVTHVLRPLTGDKWSAMRDEIVQDRDEHGDDAARHVVDSEESSIADATQTQTPALRDDGIVLDAHREVRVKLYMGQVFLGWIWLIPAFHMDAMGAGPTVVTLTRSEVDFPLGIGSAILDVRITMDWCV